MNVKICFISNINNRKMLLATPHNKYMQIYFKRIVRVATIRVVVSERSECQIEYWAISFLIVLYFNVVKCLNN